MTDLTQSERIAKHLRQYGKIDNFYCLRKRITLRLGARIFELRQRGWKIATETRDNRNTVYRLVHAGV